MVEEIFSRISESATRKLRVKSALNPILWLCAIAMPTCFSAAYSFRANALLCMVLIIAGCVPLAVACLGFIGFAIFRPEKLQSEDFQLRHQALQLIQQKAGRLVVSPMSVTAIANPEHPLLPPPEGSDGA